MQENILRFFQSISTPLGDKFFTYITMLGEQYCIILVVSWIFWNYSKKEGIFLSYIFILSAMVNNIAKDIAQTKRPFQVLKGIEGKRVSTAIGFSFPSGHTQGATTLFVTLGLIFKNKIVMTIGILLSLLVAVSRMYLGVHWPIDVIGGFVFALTISLIFYPLLNKLYSDQTRFFRFLLYSTGFYYNILLILFLLNNSVLVNPIELKAYVIMVGIASGAFLGFFVEEKKFPYTVHAILWKKILRFFIGAGGMIGIFIGLDIVLPENLIFTFIKFFFIGAWISCIFPLLGLYLRLFDKQDGIK